MTSDKFKEMFDEQGNFQCPFCSHKIPIKVQNEIPGYAFRLDHIMANDSVRLQREESISILEKKWRWKTGVQWLSLSAVSFMVILSIAFSQDAKLSQWSAIFVGLFLLSLILFLVSTFLFLQRALNSTRIMMKKDRLVIAQMPLSFSSLQVILFDDILGYEFWKNRSENSPLNFTFSFNIKLKDGKSVKVAPCSELSEALYLEKTLLELILIEKTAPPPVDEYVQ